MKTIYRLIGKFNLSTRLILYHYSGMQKHWDVSVNDKFLQVTTCKIYKIYITV